MADQPEHYLEPIDGARLTHCASWWNSRGFVYLRLSFGSARVGYERMSRRRMRTLLADQQVTPVYLTNAGPIRYWLYRDAVFADRRGLPREEVEGQVGSRGSVLASARNGDGVP